MFNPFDLSGPQFLLFYVLFGLAVIFLLRALLLHREKELYRSRWDYTDPYKLAYLRGGANESLRVALFSLIDRGLIKASDELLVAAGNAAESVTRPVEKAVVDVFRLPRQLEDLFSDRGAELVAESYRDILASDSLLSNDDIFNRRWKMVLSALALLIGVSLIKIVVAFARGRHNIWFLIILTVIFSIGVLSVWQMKRTGAGDEALRELGLRFRTLKLRAASIRPGGMTNEAALLAAVFGLTSLPGDYFPYIKTLFPKIQKQSRGYFTSGGSSSGCGSSGCGSGGCGSGGCGGGGCGGGCGGCGG